MKNYIIEKVILSGERGEIVVVRRNNGKKFYHAFIAKNGTFTKVSTTGYNSLEEATAW